MLTFQLFCYWLYFRDCLRVTFWWMLAVAFFLFGSLDTQLSENFDFFSCWPNIVRHAWKWCLWNDEEDTHKDKSDLVNFRRNYWTKSRCRSSQHHSDWLCAHSVISNRWSQPKRKKNARSVLRFIRSCYMRLCAWCDGSHMKCNPFAETYIINAELKWSGCTHWIKKQHFM